MTSHSQTEPSTDDRFDPTQSDAVRGLDAAALGVAAALVAAAVMVALGVFGALGVFESAVVAMQQWHLFFAPTLVGTLGGVVEAVVVTFVLVYAFARMYNALAG